MEVIHRYGFNSSRAELLSSLRDEEIKLDIDPILTVFTISEQDPRWPKVEEVVRRNGLIGGVSTTFTEAERRQAEYLAMQPTWHNGYPQPEDDYEETSYDLTNHCATCGIGKIQKAPLRIKGEPNWGRRSIMQLNWIFDEFFTKPEIWETVFRPVGVGCLPVLNRSGAKPFETVVQLVFEKSSPVDTTGLSFELCPVCGRKKYPPNSRGFLPRPTHPSGQAFKSIEDFGAGGNAYKEIFVSQALYQTITNAKLLGVEFSPCGRNEL